MQDYIAKDNPRAAFEVAQRIRLAVGFLEEHPKMGRAGRVRGAYELAAPGIPYIAPYRVKKKEIQILSVYHTSRRRPESFE